MNNNYCVKSERLKAYFCGRCGNRIEPQPNQKMLYCRNCRTSLEMLAECETPVYFFNACKQGLELKIVTPRVVFCNEKREGLSEERRRVSADSERAEKWLYSGIEWEELAKILFRPGSREPLIEGTEWIKDYSLDQIADAIDHGRLKKAGSGDDFREIRKAFPGIQDLYSIRMFVHIFLQKGYRFDSRISGDAERKLLSEKLYVEDYRISPAKCIACQVEADSAAGKVNGRRPGGKTKSAKEEASAAGENTAAVEEIARFYEELGKSVEEHEKSHEDCQCLAREDSFLATLHRIPVGIPTEKENQPAGKAENSAEKGDGPAGKAEGSAGKENNPAEKEDGQENYYLRVVLREGNRNLVFLFSRNYTACSRRVNLKHIFKKSLFPVGDSLQAIRAYDRIYPESHLMQYMNASYNVLVPLLAADYHTGIELAAKAGAACVAERFHDLEISKQDPFSYKNLKEMIGLPALLLRKLPPVLASDRNFNSLERMMRRRPEYVQLRRITSPLFHFYHFYWFSRRVYAEEGEHVEHGRMTKEENRTLRMLRCISEHITDTGLYLDYIHFCEELDQFVYGIEPSVPIREAHDEAYDRLEKRRYARQLEQRAAEMSRFAEVVSDPSYLSLTTSLTDMDRTVFADDSYEIIAPKEMADLFSEGHNMHNCVATYINSVIYGRCKIYFLRRKKDPDKSFGTIEVRRGCLIQAKGVCNRYLDIDSQVFVRKWCKYKNLVIRTSDLHETA